MPIINGATAERAIAPFIILQGERVLCLYLNSDLTSIVAALWTYSMVYVISTTVWALS